VGSNFKKDALLFFKTIDKRSANKNVIFSYYYLLWFSSDLNLNNVPFLKFPKPKY